MSPNEASFFIHAGIVGHYLEGAFYPVGGPQEISRALIPTILSAGGRVLVNAPVKSFLMAQTGSVTGVELENGSVLRASVVVSAAGAVATDAILRVSAPSKNLLRGVPVREALVGGISHMYAFLGIEGDSAELQLPSSNLWVIPGENIHEDLQKYYANPFEQAEQDKIPLFIGFPSAKDPNFKKKHPGKSTCVVITEAREEWFEEWEGSVANKRGQQYESFKNRFRDVLVRGVTKHYPQLEGRVR